MRSDCDNNAPIWAIVVAERFAGTCGPMVGIRFGKRQLDLCDVPGSWREPGGFLRTFGVWSGFFGGFWGCLPVAFVESLEAEIKLWS